MAGQPHSAHAHTAAGRSDDHHDAPPVSHRSHYAAVARIATDEKGLGGAGEDRRVAGLDNSDCSIPCHRAAAAAADAIRPVRIAAADGAEHGDIVVVGGGTGHDVEYALGGGH